MSGLGRREWALQCLNPQLTSDACAHFSLTKAGNMTIQEKQIVFPCSHNTSNTQYVGIFLILTDSLIFSERQPDVLQF
jgi:hypothetical protein